MRRRIGIGEDNRMAVDSGHRLNHSTIEGLRHRADTYDSGWFNRLNRLDEISRWRMQMSVRFLEIRQVIAPRFDQTVYIEEPCSGASLVARNTFERM